jgi:hypothetical protein
MTKIAPVHHARHAKVQLRLPSDAANLRFTLLGLSELTSACADFPMCLAKEAETGRFNLIALLSLAEPRNLFWLNQRWQATYMPEAATTAPFLLDPNGAYGLAIDEDRIAADDNGVRLFEADGRPAEVLKRMPARLKRVTSDIAEAQAMVDKFGKLRLIRPLQLILRHDDGREHQIDGLYTVGTEALATLADESVLQLYRAGYLAAAAIMSASLAQIERLRQLHNATSANRIADARITIEE